ncbi:hypothetical protein TSAR_013619 [Trichomalopsis sarcophagae]|uniref:Uncharacterized protein n=1 Tax=Trichomalopsis sarcophagae TaxID=543379 RepID=A0A232ELN6_9HYME|nr:hypothetical protein TSAR_013619 [Trichomalopsis sarcophagae]
MTDDGLRKENMMDGRSEKKKGKDIIEKMTEVRLEKKRCKDIVANMTKIRLEKNEEVIYCSIDYARHRGVGETPSNVELKYPTEYLNSLKFLGFPVHKLT